MEHSLHGFRAMVCAKSPQRALALETILRKLGVKTTTISKTAEAEREALTHLPHLIIADVLLDDGNLGNIYDRFHRHPLLAKIPIIACVLKKSKEELLPLANRKFSAIMLGQPDAKTFAQQVIELFSKAGGSPFRTELANSSMLKSVSLGIGATAVGRLGDSLALQAPFSVDDSASFVCKPDVQKLSPVVLKMPKNITQGEKQFILFPLARVTGRGRDWIEKLPQLSQLGLSADSAATAGAPTQKKIIFFEPDKQRFLGFAKILEDYGLHAIHAETLRGTLDALLVEDAVRCVFLHELLNDSQGIHWREQFAKLPKDKKPIAVVATAAANPRSGGGFLYVHRPCGMGAFLETLNTAVNAQDELNKTSMDTLGSVSVQIEVSGRVCSLDENGGTILVPSPLPENATLCLRHPSLPELWEGNDKVRVLRNARTSQAGGGWIATFEALGATGAKSKFLDKLDKFVKRFPPETPAA